MKKFLFACILMFYFFPSTGNAQASEELGTIILWRTGEYNHPNLRNRVALDGVHFGNLTKSNYIKLYLPPGTYELEVGHIEYISNNDPSKSDGKWVHPDEGGTYSINVQAGMVYNIMGKMYRNDPKDTTTIDDKLKYHVELERYRGTYGYLQYELSSRKLNKNKDNLFTVVRLTLSTGKKINGCIIRSTDKTLTYVPLKQGYLYEKEVSKSSLRSIVVLNE